jgi:succinyl-CoA synthetase alpha subunit
VVGQLTEQNLGQSTCVGIGGDPLIGTSFVDCLKLFKDDAQTEAVVLIGEIGGNAEQDAAEYIRKEFKKPVFAFIAGRSAPKGRPMGHAGAVISGKSSTPEEKIAALKAAGITYVESLADVGAVVRKALRG